MAQTREQTWLRKTVRIESLLTILGVKTKIGDSLGLLIDVESKFLH
jgi:hypothetical protein